MNFSPPHVITIADLFCNFDVNKLKGNGKWGSNNIKEIYKAQSKNELARKIFFRYFCMLVLYLIEGGRTFVFPFNKYMDMHFQLTPEQITKNRLKLGYLKDIDMLQSNFKSYDLVIARNYGTKVSSQTMKLSANFLQLLHEKISSGYVYV